MNSTNRYLIAFLLDHCSPNKFYSIIDSGKAPHLSKYILGVKNSQGNYENAAISRQTAASFPSSSANSHPCLITGCYGGKNNHFKGYYWKLNGNFPEFINTDKLSISTLYRYPREYLSPAAKTIFEYIPGSSSYYVLNRGAKWKLFSLRRIITDFVPFFIQMRKEKEPGAIQPIAQPDLWRTLLHKHIGKMLEKVKKNGQLPPASYLTLLLTDQFAHYFGFASNRYEEAFDVLDDCVRVLVEGVDDSKKGHIAGLKELNLLDQINWVIFSDHAGRPVIRDHYIMLDTVITGDLGLRIIEGENSKNEIARLKKECKAFKGNEKLTLGECNLFSAYGSEEMFYWAAPHKEDGLIPHDFTAFYGEKLFRNMKPKNKFVPIRLDHVDLITYLIEKPWIQFVIIPEENPEIFTPPKIDNNVRIQMAIPRIYQIKFFAKNGASLVNRKLENGEKYYQYQVVNGTDPLDYKKAGWEYTRWYSAEETLKLTIDHILPDMFHKMFGLFDAPLAPNFVVTSSFDFHFWASKTVHENEIREIQTHGGLYSEECIVPSIFAGPSFEKGIEIPYARNIDMLPTMLKAMNIEYDPNRLDGKPIGVALKKK